MSASENTRLREIVEKTIHEHKMISPGETVIAGVSGGMDSMCLLDVLISLAGKLDFTIKVCHFNHSLRGDESDGDEIFVSGFCEAKGLLFHSTKRDVALFASQSSKSIEEAARICRYDYLQQCAGEKNAKIAVAHHMNDQFETVMLNLLRGAGTAGIAGMRYVSGNIIRPLLDCKIEDIRDHAEKLGIEYRTDSTNLLPDCDRNRIRLKVLPVLEKNFNRNVVEATAKTASICRADDDHLCMLADEFFISNRTEKGINCKALSSLDFAVFSRVIRKEYERAKGNRTNLTFKQIRIILEYISEPSNNGSLDLSDKMMAVVRDGLFSICHANEGMGTEVLTNINQYASHVVEYPCEKIYEDMDLRLKIDFKDKIDSSIVKKDDLRYNTLTYVFPEEALDGAVLRFIKPHDRIRPNRGSGSKRVRKYLNESKVPPEKRDRMPVIARGNEIICIFGLKQPDIYDSGDLRIFWGHCSSI